MITEVDRRYFDEMLEREEASFRYISLSTDRLLFSMEASQVIESSFKHSKPQPVLTYLANEIWKEGSAVRIPYSLVSAVDSNESLGPLLLTNDSNLTDGEVVLNAWAAEDLNAKPGDTIHIRYFEPETSHGESKETTRTLRLHSIAPLVKPVLPYSDDPARYVEPPALTNDPDLTPTVVGFTDQESIDSWDPPFPYDPSRIRKPKDEDYWDNYRTTPKAFVRKSVGDEIWGSRFGNVTSYRFTTEDHSVASITEKLESAISANLPAFGFTLLPLKANGINAASGTTPFNFLFLGFSFFIMTAAILLVGLLFRLNVEQRASDSGLLLAVGLTRWQTTRLLLMEGALISVVGAVLGTLIGIAYASIMLVGLRTWWLDAVVTPFLALYVSPGSLVLGALLGVFTTILTTLLTVRDMRHVSTCQLMSGETETFDVSRNRPNRFRYLYLLVFAIAVVLAILGIFLSGEAQAGAFFGAGAAFLCALLLMARNALHVPARSVMSWQDNPGRFGGTDLAFRNASRNPGRSVLTIGLMATASFLVVAISAFRLAPTEEGTARFDLVATSELPILEDLNNPDVRTDLIGDAEQLQDITVLALRYHEGEDASCRNLYQTTKPRVLGVTQTMISHFEDESSAKFKWSASSADSPETLSNPWRLLQHSTPDDEPIPVVLDKNTAMYSLHLYQVGQEFELDYGTGEPIRFRVAGMLSNSILQGSLLIGEEDLLRVFHRTGGFQYFLIDCGEESSTKAVTELLENTFRNEGFDAKESRELLNDLLAVQNTYLSTFQSLGGIGLLLGTFGLMAVQLRNVWQRRGEIALLRSTGFSQRRIGEIVLIEHAMLLLGGLGIGTVSALLTVLPHVFFGGASIPLGASIGMLVLISIVGVLTGIVAVYSCTKLPVLQMLRGD